jgi:hypothetical protein
MSDRISYKDGGNKPHRPRGGEVTVNAHQQVGKGMPNLRGGDGAASMGDGTRFNGWWIDDSAAARGASNGNQSVLSDADGPDSDCYEIPAPRYEAPRAPRQGYRQDGHAARAPAPTRGGFDFNNHEQPLPWNERNETPQRHDDYTQVLFFLTL